VPAEPGQAARQGLGRRGARDLFECNQLAEAWATGPDRSMPLLGFPTRDDRGFPLVVEPTVLQRLGNLIRATKTILPSRKNKEPRGMAGLSWSRRGRLRLPAGGFCHGRGKRTGILEPLFARG
jgi:hypothetical protein